MQMPRHHARWLRECIAADLRRIAKLRRRVERVYGPKNPLWKSLMTAEDALSRARMEAHYMSCESGVGHPAADSG